LIIDESDDEVPQVNHDIDIRKMAPIEYHEAYGYLSEMKKPFIKNEIILPADEKKALLKRYQDADFWFQKAMRSNPGAENRDMAVYQYK